jgi:general secretion pathway protein D
MIALLAALSLLAPLIASPQGRGQPAPPNTPEPAQQPPQGNPGPGDTTQPSKPANPAQGNPQGNPPQANPAQGNPPQANPAQPNAANRPPQPGRPGGPGGPGGPQKATIPQAPAPAPSGTPAVSNKQKVPAIQDIGEFYLLNFDETASEESLTLEQFVKSCQEVTGYNFTYTKETASQLAGLKLRMFGSKRIPKADFYSFFQIMMIINDFVCSKIGPEHISVVLISSLNANTRGGLKQDAVYVLPQDLDRYADQPATLITTIVDLPNTDVRTLSNSMRTMFTDQNTQQIIPVGNSNSLIITGFGSIVASIVRMLKLVDDASKAQSGLVPEFEVIPLEFASAEEISETISDLLEASRRALQSRTQVAGAQGVTAPLQSGSNESKIMVDPRTNSLLVMAMPDDMPRIKELVARLDVEVIERDRTYHIYKLENVSADDLSKTLENFIKDAGRITTGATSTGAGGRPGTAAATTSSTSAARNEIVVVPDKATNSLLIAANRTRYEEVLELIRRLDQRQDQVLIETALIELTGSNLLDIGVELGGVDLPGSGTGAFGVTSFGLSTFQDTNNDGIPDVKVPNGANGTPPQGLTAGILNGKNFSLPILVYALKMRRDTNVLSVPSVLVNNNGTAKVVSKDQEPTTTVTALGASAQTQQSFGQYVDAGITLQISPTISASRYLRLKVTLEVSTFIGAVSGAIPPPKVTRTIDTVLNVPDGDTMVIGGIVSDTKSRTSNGVPWLADIPILGYLFKRQSDELDRTTLYFFVTPHIMKDRDFADLAELSYKKKLEAAEEIGTERIQVIDPTFGHSEKSLKGVDMKGFEVPLYRSPPHGEVNSSSVGLDAARVHTLLKDAENPPKPNPNPDAGEPKQEDAKGQEPKPQDTKPQDSKPPEPKPEEPPKEKQRS